MQIYPDIFRLEIPLPDQRLNTVNIYVIKSNQGAMLIDTGWNTDQAYQALQSQLAAIDLSLSDLQTVVITHFHPDHIGLIDRLIENSPAIFIRHTIEHDLVQRLRSKPEINSAQMENWLLQNGLPPQINSEMDQLTASIFKLGTGKARTQLVNGGETISFGRFNFEILWTPGHSPGLICLYEPEHQLLFSSDHVLGHTTPNISLFREDGSNPLGDYLSSLEIVKMLDVKLTLPAHGDLITDLPARIDQMITHHQFRLQELLAAFGDRSLNAYQLASAVSWAMDWQTMPYFHKRFALTETLAHLELLRSRGQVQRTQENGIFWYQIKK